MVAHVLRAAAGARPEITVLVVSPESSDLHERLGPAFSPRIVVQDPPLGTGDAVRTAMAAIDDVTWAIVLYADHPLLTAETVARLRRLLGRLPSRARARSSSAPSTLSPILFPVGTRAGLAPKKSGVTETSSPTKVKCRHR